LFDILSEIGCIAKKGYDATLKLTDFLKCRLVHFIQFYYTPFHKILQAFPQDFPKSPKLPVGKYIFFRNPPVLSLYRFSRYGFRYCPV